MMREAGTTVILLAYVAVSMTSGALIVCEHDNGHTFLEWASDPCCAPSNTNPSDPVEHTICCARCESAGPDNHGTKAMISISGDTCADQALVMDDATSTDTAASSFFGRDFASTFPGPVAPLLFEIAARHGVPALNCGPPLHPVTTLLKNVVILC